MKLIADSGSTKTDWVLLEGEKVGLSFRTPGLNPYFVSTSEAFHILQDSFSKYLKGTRVNSVHFYGAGCSSAEKKEIIGSALRQLLPGAAVYTEHDMLAAARALFGNSPGIACILGTGSNSCHYNGQIIAASLFSLGYMFGDEGSGAHLGKTYIAAHLKNKVPGEIQQAFIKRYALSKEEILTHVYKKANPNRFLASFTPFLKDHLEHEYIARMVKKCFDAFMREQVCQFADHKRLPMGCIGSVGYHFRGFVEKAAKKHGADPRYFMVSPMEGLVSYHSENNQ